MGSENLIMSSPVLPVADTLLHVHAEPASPVQERVKEPHSQTGSGQLEESPPTGLRTPANSVEGNLTN